MKKKGDFKNITLEQLARMVDDLAQAMAKGFATLEERFDKVELDVDDLGDRIDRHMGSVRRDTDAVARRVKRVERTVFGVGK